MPPKRCLDSPGGHGPYLAIFTGLYITCLAPVDTGF